VHEWRTGGTADDIAVLAKMAAASVDDVAAATGKASAGRRSAS
jgi:carbohydrate-binding DOMON domain-containing protein